VVRTTMHIIFASGSLKQAVKKSAKMRRKQHDGALGDKCYRKSKEWHWET
jgi:hypothetical protein